MRLKASRSASWASGVRLDACWWEGGRTWTRRSGLSVCLCVGICFSPLARLLAGSAASGGVGTRLADSDSDRPSATHAAGPDQRLTDDQR